MTTVARGRSDKRRNQVFAVVASTLAVVVLAAAPADAATKRPKPTPTPVAASTSVGQWQSAIPAGDPSAYAYFPTWPRFDPCTPIRWAIDNGSIDPANRTPDMLAGINALLADVFEELDARTAYQFAEAAVPDGAGLPVVANGFPAYTDDADIVIAFMWPTALAGEHGGLYPQPVFDSPETAQVIGLGGSVYTYTASGPRFIAMSRVAILGSWQGMFAAGTALARTVLLHETEHALGLTHVGAPGQSMSMPSTLTSVTMGAGDIAGLDSLAAQGCRQAS